MLTAIALAAGALSPISRSAGIRRITLARMGASRIPEMVAEIYRDVDPALHGAAALSMLAQAEWLAERGLLHAEDERGDNSPSVGTFSSIKTFSTVGTFSSVGTFSTVVTFSPVGTMSLAGVISTVTLARVTLT